MPVTSLELQHLREEVQTWYTEACDILSVTRSEDDYGGEDFTETTVASAVPCFLETTPGREQIIPYVATLTAEHIFVVYLPPEIEDTGGNILTLEVGMHLIITTRDNLHLRIQAVLAPETLDIEQVVAANILGEHN